MPKDTSEGRDHGRRFYVSSKPYIEQIRMRTDAFMARYGKKPHSEDKKPYLDDLDYPEMEHFNFDWDNPSWPPFEPPDVPGLPPGDPGFPYNPNKEKPRTPFLGCLFYPPRFNPYMASPGETAFAYFALKEGDAVKNFETHGPIKMISSPGEFLDGCRGTDGKRRSKCLLAIKVLEDVSGYGPAEGTGQIQGVLVVNLQSGESCSASILITPCAQAPPLLWDWENSPETISRSSTVAVYVTGGVGPFRWAVSGTGFSLADDKTTGRTNLLTAAANACGSATILVSDACSQSTGGSVRCTFGQWVQDIPAVIKLCGMPRNDGNYVTAGKDRMLQFYSSPGFVWSGACGEYVPPCSDNWAENANKCGRECSWGNNMQQCEAYMDPYSAFDCDKAGNAAVKCLPVSCSDAEWGEPDAVECNQWWKCASQACELLGYSFLWCLCTKSYASWEWKC